ncbi:MAG: hypothetical protein LC776_00835 [Acidobacteria bacterium]|nr:hypothetical protein [Acidobacteriota bacterium]
MVELDVALMAAAGESLRVRYRHRPRLHRQRLIQQALDLERTRQEQRQQFAGLTEQEQLAAMVTAMFDAERRAPW